MSTIKLTGATSGTISLVPTAIAGTNTITLPAETGTARTTVSSGTVLQVVNYQTGAVATGTTQMPYDDTIPQNTEGNEYMSLAITPKSATSKLVIQIIAMFTGNPGAGMSLTLALFQDSTANALAAIDSYQTTNGGVLTIPLIHYMTSGTTSSTTFKVRAGMASAGTTTFNGTNSGRYFGGVAASSITITEVVP